MVYNMAKNLLIVESPAKAKTIEKILGSDFQVKSCYGHIRDLEKAGMGIDIEKNFKPRYIVPEPIKRRVVKELKASPKANLVKYGWQRMRTVKEKRSAGIFCEVLGLDPKTTKRIVFHEITKPAIQRCSGQSPET
jgi:DNA topoisomerase-1